MVNRKYFKKPKVIYIFPVGFLESSDVFNEDFKNNYSGWYNTVVDRNRSQEIGIIWFGHDNAYSYFTKYDLEITSRDYDIVYISNNGILGGL